MFPAGCTRNGRDRLPTEMSAVLRRLQLLPTRFILTIHVASQTLRLWKRGQPSPVRSCRGQEADTSLTQSATSASSPRWPLAAGALPVWRLRAEYRISTSALGVGQTMHSLRTPLGLHRVARKIGGGHPIGTVFQARRAVGLTWQGMPEATIVHRILWLEGLEPGLNRNGSVDTFQRFIYIHGFGDETTLGRPRSRGCVHMAARDLLPLYDALPAGSLVWIAER